jgi:hypothetical protein
MKNCNFCKPWWPGDSAVEPFMPKIDEAIKKHLPWPSEAYTDIYNRAYEAVYDALKGDNGKKISNNKKNQKNRTHTKC